MGVGASGPGGSSGGSCAVPRPTTRPRLAPILLAGLLSLFATAGHAERYADRPEAQQFIDEMTQDELGMALELMKMYNKDPRVTELIGILTACYLRDRPG